MNVMGMNHPSKDWVIEYWWSIQPITHRLHKGAPVCCWLSWFASSLGFMEEISRQQRIFWLPTGHETNRDWMGFHWILLMFVGCNGEKKWWYNRINTHGWLGFIPEPLWESSNWMVSFPATHVWLPEVTSKAYWWGKPWKNHENKLHLWLVKKIWLVGLEH